MNTNQMNSIPECRRPRWPFQRRSAAWLPTLTLCLLSCLLTARAAVTVTATDATAGEPGEGNGTATFTFTRTGSIIPPLTVNFTVGGTATSGTDYTNLGTTVTFAVGSSTATKTVSVIDDTLVEGDETVLLTLAAGTGYTIGSPSSAEVTIADDDTVVTVTATDAMAGEPSDPGTFTFTRTGYMAPFQTVNFTVGGTATSGSDYTNLGTTVTFAWFSPTAVKTVSVIDDTLVEGDETVVLSLAPGDYVVASPSSARVTIADDDAVPPSATTQPATGITSAGATLNGTFNPNGVATTGWFQWGTNTTYGNTTAHTNLGSGGVTLAMNQSLSGLQGYTTYHFRAAAGNAAGITYGSDATFTTLPSGFNVCASQRSGTKLVDIYYDVAGPLGGTCTVGVLVSTNGGTTYNLPAFSFSGDGYGARVTPGNNKQIVWDAGADWSGKSSANVRFRVSANFGVSMSSVESRATAVDTRNTHVTVSGRVRSETGAALAGATVTLAGQTATTLADGSYTLSGINLNNGNTMTVSTNGFVTSAQTAQIPAGSLSVALADSVLRNAFSVDTNNPVITGFNPQYDGIFLEGVPILNHYITDVNWNGYPPNPGQPCHLELSINDNLVSTILVLHDGPGWMSAEVDMGQNFVGRLKPGVNKKTKLR